MAVDGAPACAPLCFTYEGCSRGQTQTGVSIKKKERNHARKCAQVDRVERGVANCLFGWRVWAKRVIIWQDLKTRWDITLIAAGNLL